MYRRVLGESRSPFEASVFEKNGWVQRSSRGPGTGQGFVEERGLSYMEYKIPDPVGVLENVPSPCFHDDGPWKF